MALAYPQELVDQLDQETKARAVAALEKATESSLKAARLKSALPSGTRTPEDLRALTVWWAQEQRATKAMNDALNLIFDEVVPEGDDEAMAAIRRRDLDALGERLRLFADFCADEVLPRIERLERGVALIERTPPGDEREKYRRLYARIRQEVRDCIPEAWALAHPAAFMYRRLPDDLREEAERTWGPLTGTDPSDFSPVWHRHFPSKRLNAADDRLKATE